MENLWNHQLWDPVSMHKLASFGNKHWREFMERYYRGKKVLRLISNVSYQKIQVKRSLRSGVKKYLTGSRHMRKSWGCTRI